jgi:hypothetical protein
MAVSPIREAESMQADGVFQSGQDVFPFEKRIIG